MALVSGSHTVLIFTQLQFIGDFTRWSGTVMIGYTPNKDSELIVVTEDTQGNKTTHWFKLEKDREVWVNYNEVPEVHIPAICVKRAAGDKMTCKG
ncbi:MAG TPA: hypothetical protein VGX21_10665 [Methylomirabilota bacterium]|jgi:hypothetical protein|nr:hypothetical protein [Methylomirabilota bacterium]